MQNIGIFIGLSGDQTPNVEKLLKTWAECISDYQLEAFGGATPPDSCPCPYFSMDHSQYFGPYSKIMVGLKTCLQYIQKRNPDVLFQLVKFNTHATPVALAGYLTGTPTVVRLSGAVYDSYRGSSGHRRLFSYLLNRCINGIFPPQLSTKSIAFGEYSQKQLLERGCSPKNIFILPPAGVEDRFHPVENKQKIRQELGIEFNDKVALYVGRMSKLKGMPFLKQVIQEFSSNSKIRFVLVGDGPFRDDLKSEFRDTVVTPGTVPYSKIDQYYKAADFYIHPSPFEGIPLVIIEALSTGIPVLARRAGDIPSVTPNIVDSPEEMVQKIRQENYSSEWLNPERFTVQYQRKTLQTLIESALNES